MLAVTTSPACKRLTLRAHLSPKISPLRPQRSQRVANPHHPALPACASHADRERGFRAEIFRGALFKSFRVSALNTRSSFARFSASPQDSGLLRRGGFAVELHRASNLTYTSLHWEDMAEWRPAQLVELDQVPDNGTRHLGYNVRRPSFP